MDVAACVICRDELEGTKGERLDVSLAGSSNNATAQVVY